MLPYGKHINNIVFVTGADLNQWSEALVALRAVLEVDCDLFANWELQDHFLEALESFDVGKWVGERLGWGGVGWWGGEEFW